MSDSSNLLFEYDCAFLSSSVGVIAKLDAFFIVPDSLHYCIVHCVSATVGIIITLDLNFEAFWAPFLQFHRVL